MKYMCSEKTDQFAMSLLKRCYKLQLSKSSYKVLVVSRMRWVYVRAAGQFRPGRRYLKAELVTLGLLGCTLLVSLSVVAVQLEAGCSSVGTASLGLLDRL